MNVLKLKKALAKALQKHWQKHFQIQIQIIYFKSVSYTWYFLNWKCYKQTTNYFTQKKNYTTKCNTIKLP